MKMIDLKCEFCDHIVEDRLIRDIDPEPPYECPACHMQGLTRVHLPNACGGVKDDSIPGGFWAKNGICNADGTPKRYDSWSDVRKAEQATGWVNRVRHVGRPGSDKSPHTTRWT